MAITYVQASNPYWYFSDMTGKSAGAGEVWFMNSLDPDALKPVFQDRAGLIPYPNPIDINLNGTIPPIYFQVDSTGAAGNYDIYAYDAQGNLIEQMNSFTPSSGGGGGSITEIFHLENLIVNNVMYRNYGTIDVSGAAGGLTVLAPGVHQGLASTVSNFGPDITYYKNIVGATETISFPPFQLGLLPMDPSDTTPYDYLHFYCSSGASSGETAKYVQFPLTNKVQNLSNRVVSGTIWGRCTSGNTALTIKAVQFFGDGSAASNPSSTGNTVTTTLMTITLDATWTQYSFSGVTIPSVASATVGQCGNDGLFIQIGLPLNNAATIDFTKPALYLGTNFPTLDYTNYDEISGIVEAPRTGDIRIGLNSFAPCGWVLMNDTSIGAVGSGATTAALNTFPLYNLLWNAVGANYAPMVSGSYGASAIADFEANRAMYLTKQLGRLIAQHGLPSSGNNTGTNWLLGQATGSEETIYSANHTHPITSLVSTGGAASGSTATQVGTYGPIQTGASGQPYVLFGVLGGSGSAGPLTLPGAVNSVSVTGSGNTGNPSNGVAQLNIQNPVSYYNVMMKL